MSFGGRGAAVIAALTEAVRPEVVLRLAGILRWADYEPASVFVVDHVHAVYGCQKGCDEKVERAAKPVQMIEKTKPKLAVYKFSSCDGCQLG